jgi:tRNA(adenine34) deaminase
MCAGALVLARVAHLVYGAPDPKGGGVDSLYKIGQDGLLNHTFTVTGGVLEEECAQLLRDFFRRLRA